MAHRRTPRADDRAGRRHADSAVPRRQRHADFVAPAPISEAPSPRGGHVGRGTSAATARRTAAARGAGAGPSRREPAARGGRRVGTTPPSSSGTASARRRPRPGEDAPTVVAPAPRRARPSTARRQPVTATPPREPSRRRPPPSTRTRSRSPQARKARAQAAQARTRARRTIRTNRRSLATRFSAGQPRRRLIIALIFMLVVLMLVLFKVGMLQTFQGDSLRSAAERQWTRVRPIPAQRGAIFDRNGDELALSVPAATVAVNPQQVVDADATVDTLADILDLSDDTQTELLAKMAPKDRGFLYVARQVDPELAEQIDALELIGVSTYREDRRTVPGGVTALSVIGRTDIDSQGIAGLELQYNDVLMGTEGQLRLEVAPDGSSVAGSGRVVEPAAPGEDLVLTIDRSVQYAVEQALLARSAETQAQGAQAIVMDTDTGELIAMASVNLDDGVYEVTSGNYSAVSAYEPGSVGKVITVAGALNEGTVTPETSFSVPWRKVYTRAGDMLHDSHEHAEVMMSVHDILVQSSNIGTITVSESMGFEKQYEYMRAFGLGDVTGLDFPQESAGILKPWQQWEGTEKYTVAYGQGVASTPIQLVTAVNTVANDGVHVEPKLVLGTVDADGEIHEADPAAEREVVSQAVAERMQLMLRDVVCEGTATKAQVPGLSVAGKTGTGYIAQPDGTYFLPSGARAYYTSFVGFLPAEDPQVTILVSIDQPVTSGDRNGGGAAGPVFRDLAPTMVHELGINPPPGSTGCQDPES